VVINPKYGKALCTVENEFNKWFFLTHRPEIHPRGKPKGIKRVLQERGLWRERRADGCRFLLECPTTGGGTGCDRGEDGNLIGGCYARAVLAVERDFRDQKRMLEEELLAEGQKVIFYPKFHCELNCVERFWCAAKFYARENY